MSNFKKISINIHIPFYNYNGDKSRTRICRKIFSHFKNIRTIFENKADINFTVVGSEKEFSKYLALEYFRENEYFEYDQTIIKDFNLMFNDKINFGIRKSIENNPDIILTASSNDFICTKFFEQIIDFYNPDVPQIYGIDNYYDGNNLVYEVQYDYLNNKLITNKGFYWDGVQNYCQRDKYKYTGGIIGTNKKTYLENKFIIDTWGCNECITESNLLNINGIQKFNSVNCYYFNIKTTSSKELNNFDFIINLFNSGQLKSVNELEIQTKIKDEIIKDIKYFEEIDSEKKVIIFGNGNNADLAYYYLKNDSPYKVVAFTVESNFIKDKYKFDLPVVEFENIINIYSNDEYYLFAPCNASNLNKFRERIYNKGKELGYKYINYISSKASIFTSDIGENCFIMENNVIQPFTKIGNNCILWSGNHIGHHSIIEDHVFLTSHVVICGLCKIKSYSFIGVNSSIKDGTTIKENTVIGMSSCVTKDTESYNIYIGSPAKIFKSCDDNIKL